MFYGGDSHAESAAIFSLIASCRLHGIDPQLYLDEVMRLLPYWPKERYLELVPKYWRGTRATSNRLSSKLTSVRSPSRRPRSTSRTDAITPSLALRA